MNQMRGLHRSGEEHQTAAADGLVESDDSSSYQDEGTCALAPGIIEGMVVERA